MSNPNKLTIAIATSPDEPCNDSLHKWLASEISVRGIQLEAIQAFVQRVGLRVFMNDERTGEAMLNELAELEAIEEEATK